MITVDMKVTSTQLRQNIYKLLDQLIETGVPIEIERRGHTLLIIDEKPHDKLKNIQPFDNLINGSLEEIENIDWSKEWKNDLS